MQTRPWGAWMFGRACICTCFAYACACAFKHQPVCFHTYEQTYEGQKVWSACMSRLYVWSKDTRQRAWRHWSIADFNPHASVGLRKLWRVKHTSTQAHKHTSTPTRRLALASACAQLQKDARSYLTFEGVRTSHLRAFVPHI
jgi:hypothetical protein